MAWSQSAENTITHAGLFRDVFTIEGERAPASYSLKLGGTDCAHNIKACVFMSRDGSCCWEVGIQGDNIVIQRADFGAVIDPVFAAIGHSFAVGSPWALEVRVDGAVISVYEFGSSTAKVTFDTGGQYNEFSGYGVSAMTDGAFLSEFQICDLTPATETRSKILVFVANGDTWRMTSELGLTKVGVGTFRASGHVSLAEFGSKIYGVDGTRGREFDPVTDVVDLWETDDGSALPGGDSTAGSTTLDKIAVHSGRIVGVRKDEARILYACELNNPLGWDTAADTVGRAYATTLSRAAQSGQAIRAIVTGAQQQLFIAGSSSVWRLTGDPVLGMVSLEPASLTVGASGPNAMAMVDEGRVVMHGPTGLYLIPPAGDPIPFAPYLTEGITFDPADIESYRVTLIRDARRKVLHIFITPTNVLEAGLHFVYDERAGGYNPSTPALFPVEYPAAVGPTCAEVYQGQIIIGGNDGYAYVLDDEETSDDGTAIEQWAILSRLADDGLERDTLLKRLFPVLSPSSDDVIIRAWRGATAEDAFDTSLRSLGWQRTGVGPLAPAISQTLVGGCILIEVRSEALDNRIVLEAFEAEAQSVKAQGRYGYAASVVAGSLCRTISGGSSGSGSGSGSGSYASGPGGSGSGTPAAGGGSGAYDPYKIQYGYTSLVLVPIIDYPPPIDRIGN